MANYHSKSIDRGQLFVSGEDEGKALLQHDLRSALADVLGGLQLLDSSEIGVVNQSQIARIAASAALALRLLDAPETVEKNSPKSFNLLEMLSELESRWYARIASKGMELVFQVKIEPGLALSCDRLELERLLSNILENAAKFADNGQICLTVILAEGTVKFRLTDEGPGFSAGALEKLFTYGARPSNSPKSGSGLGLYIAHKSATSMGGKIAAKNTEQGALIDVEIPMVRSKSPSPLALGAGALHLAGLRILLAEDNITNQIVAGQMLQLLGAEVVIVDDGVKAIEALQSQDFDLALLDIEMPRKSGIEVIREIRALNSPLAKLPLIALTAYVMRDHRQRILHIGADGIIAKPLMNIDDFGGEILQICKFSTSPKGEGSDVSIVDSQVYEALREAVGEAVFKGLLEKLVIDLKEIQQRLKIAFPQQDIAELRASSHVLISLTGAIGANGLMEVARELNNACHSDDLEKISQFEASALELLGELTLFLIIAHRNYSGE